MMLFCSPRSSESLIALAAVCRHFIIIYSCIKLADSSMIPTKITMPTPEKNVSFSIEILVFGVTVFVEASNSSVVVLFTGVVTVDGGIQHVVFGDSIVIDGSIVVARSMVVVIAPIVVLEGLHIGSSWKEISAAKCPKQAVGDL